ncbi:MAG: hypothetical protein LBD68_10580 [Zoogloeaceae bacterium]|jgi:hypothetical protein|nr:hypothetical protein [Zoogloeaceae bacterium]
MMIKTKISAGQMVEFHEKGDFFRLMNSGGDVNIRFFFMGTEVARSESVSGGYSEAFDGGRSFDSVQIESAITQNVHFVIRFGNKVTYDQPPVGNVSVVNNSGVINQFIADVDASEDAQLLPINSLRKYLLVQNLSEAQVIYLSFSGVVVPGGGVKLFPGASFSAEAFCPVNEVRALADADGARVLVLEG